jgi:hypothetical protein
MSWMSRRPRKQIEGATWQPAVHGQFRIHAFRKLKAVAVFPLVLPSSAGLPTRAKTLIIVRCILRTRNS